MGIRIFDHLPEGLLQTPADGLAALLGGPTLIRLNGRRDPPLFVSVLLHGNEISGWNGVRRLLAGNTAPGRSLMLFIGNVDAAAAGVRTLAHQQDYNRIWRDAAGPEAELAAALVTQLADQPLFASVDLHNNTGHNPHYSVLTDLSPRNLGLAYLFSDKAVYVEEPDTVLTRIFAERCPAIALEVGPVGDPRCDDRVYDYVARLLELDTISDADLQNLQMFRSQVRVHIAPGVRFAFAGEGSAPLVLTAGMEAVNFHPLPAGTVFASAAGDPGEVLQVIDVAHQDVTAQYFRQEGGNLVLQRSVVPAMYTTDPAVIVQDCLCYFMETMPLTP
jgi:succinylglutamate desuccinylase